MNVTILGCGPAGLMAAHGAIMGGADKVVIISRKRKSELFGSQYLHAPIPGTPEHDPVMIKYELIGESDEYREKVYGKQWDGTVSPEDLCEPHQAWDIRGTYDYLWDLYNHHIFEVDLRAAHVDAYVDSDDIVISTIPRPTLCTRGHTFGAAEVYAAGDAPERGIAIPYQCPENTVRCNGEPTPSWYRLSNVFGYRTVEWPANGSKPPLNTATAVRKPTFHNCDCHPKIIYSGRYGKWEKGVLSHTAYYDALGAVEWAFECERAR